MTQSTLSAGLKELEAQLGVELAERTSRSVMMTPIGRELAERAQALLSDAEDFVDAASANRGPLSGTLRLGVIPTVGPYVLPRLIAKIQASYPRLRLFLREAPTDSLLAQLKSGRLDTALIAFPYDVGDLTEHSLFEDGYLFACPLGHPLASHRSISGLDLKEVRLMLLEPNHCLHRHAISAIKNQVLQPDSEFEATSLSTLVAMVAEGLGVTVLPQLAIRAGITEGLRIALAPIDEMSPRRIGLTWRKTSRRAEEFVLLGELIRATAGVD